MEHALMSDNRLQLSEGNMYRYCRPNGMPKMPDGIQQPLDFKTASEIEAERKKLKKAASST